MPVTRQKQQQSVINLLREKQDENFWGKIVLSLRSGDLVMTEVNQTIPTDVLADSYTLDRP